MSQKSTKILIGVTGGIAAYKVPLLVRLFVQNNYEVKVITTPDAEQFVAVQTLSVLSKNQVYTHFFNEKREWNNHVHLADWADIFLIAPCTANTLAKIAHGYCDNLLMATYLSYTKKIFIAPAMDAEMWEHETTQQNIDMVKNKINHIVLPVEHGELASGIIGWGRMLEPDKIFGYIHKYQQKREQLKNKTVLITAGATYEPIDPARFIGNRSSGRTGIELAKECADRGAQVILIHGNVTMKLPVNPNIICVFTPTAKAMFDTCINYAQEYDIAILSAAVADYTPKNITNSKIKKQAEEITIALEKTKDILKTLGERKKTNQLLIGFALETENVIENAKEKLQRKNADMIIANECSDRNPAFSTEENKITILDRKGNAKEFPKLNKHAIATVIIDSVIDFA